MASLATLLLGASLHAGPPAAAPADEGGSLQGTVLEVRDAQAFTYLRLRTGQGEIWAALSRAPFQVGQPVRLEHTLVVENFHSKALERTFPRLVHGRLALPAGQVGAVMTQPATQAALPAGHPPLADRGAAEGADAPVTRATGADAHTVAEILTGGAELKDHRVLLRARVVKFNAGILGRNWLHLRDGTGQADRQTHDLVVTTQDTVPTGAIVTVRGTVHTDRDFGSGYVFPVLLEDAVLQP